MMPMVYTSLGIESLFFVAAASQSGLDGAVLFATGTVVAWTWGWSWNEW